MEGGALRITPDTESGYSNATITCNNGATLTQNEDGTYDLPTYDSSKITITVTFEQERRVQSMKYEEPNLEIVLFDDVYTTNPLGMSNSDDEGESEELPY